MLNNSVPPCLCELPSVKFTASIKDCITVVILKHVYLCAHTLDTCTCAGCTSPEVCNLNLCRGPHISYQHICIKVQEGTSKQNTHINPHRTHVPVVYTVLVNNSGVGESSRLQCGLLLRQQVTRQPAILSSA